MKEVYVIMFIQRLYENIFYTDESTVAKRVEMLNVCANSSNYWYQKLTRA
jgi:hypothetical protein